MRRHLEMRVINGGLEELQKKVFDALMKEDADAFVEHFTRLSKRSRQKPKIASVDS